MILYNNVFSGGKTKDNIVKVTYTELAALGESKEFDVNVIYQLTDYTISNTWAPNKGVVLTSQGHMYDLLISAYNNEFLCANVAATRHDGEDYFNEIELSQWKIIYANKYTLDIPSYFAIPVNQGNPKGVILRLTDEKNNTANFDFKNIEFNGFLLWDYQNIDMSRFGAIHDNQLELSITNLSSDKFLAFLLSYNKIIGCLTSDVRDNSEGISNFNIFLSEIHLIKISGGLNLNCLRSKNIIIKSSNGASIENVKINQCNDTLINNAEYINNTTIQFINAKTIELEEHTNKQLLVSSSENKTTIIL